MEQEERSEALQSSIVPSNLHFSTLVHQEIRALWAKSGDDAFTQGHGLLAHLLDVAAVAEVLVEREPQASLDWLRREFGLASENCARWLAALAGLHDYGKAIPGFQRKWDRGRDRVEEFGLACSPESACKLADHSLGTAVLLCSPLRRKINAYMGWVRDVVQAISAHHGYHFTASDLNGKRPVCELPVWGKAREMMLDIYWQVLAPQGVPQSERGGLSLPAANWLAGLTSVADWIGSNVEWFPLGERCDSLNDYYTDARRRAKVALDAIGWSCTRLLLSPEDSNVEKTDRLLAQILGRQQVDARPLQKSGDLLLKKSIGPSLLLIEAPMGEGKTELAFLAHLRLQALNGHRGLYIAMPTQATGNALFSRALSFLGEFVEDLTDIQLVHGGALMNENFIRLRRIDESQYETLASSAWFSQKKRPLLSAYGVGTVDQALFSVLNVKHHFVQLWGLRNRVVVFDEVHAYDTYTSELIVELVRTLCTLGCSVVLMSATLPRSRRDSLLRAWDVRLNDLPCLAYPRVVLADQKGLHGESFEARPLPEVYLEGVGESIQHIAEQAAALLEAEGCGAVIVNTVDRAQKLYILIRAILPQDVQILLFHARFPMDERSRLECEVLSLFGEKRNRPKRALLIATQVAEQSLDLDFDFMLSDLAPVDLLLQRAGRLHRHEYLRPRSHIQARLWVAGLKSDFPDLKETKWRYVYSPYLLVRTWAALRKEDFLRFPADIDRLVQEVYDGDFLEGELKERVLKLESEYIDRNNMQNQLAKNIRIDIESETHTAYDNKPHGGDIDEDSCQRNVTRLGADSITVIPVHVNGVIDCIADGDITKEGGVISDSIAKQIYARQIRLSRKDIVTHFREKGVPDSFLNHPLLRNFYLMPLIDGKYEMEVVRLRLDVELGLVYEEK